MDINKLTAAVPAMLGSLAGVLLALAALVKAVSAWQTAQAKIRKLKPDVATQRPYSSRANPVAREASQSRRWLWLEFGAVVAMLGLGQGGVFMLVWMSFSPAPLNTGQAALVAGAATCALAGFFWRPPGR